MYLEITRRELVRRVTKQCRVGQIGIHTPEIRSVEKVRDLALSFNLHLLAEEPWGIEEFRECEVDVVIPGSIVGVPTQVALHTGGGCRKSRRGEETIQEGV